MRHFTFHFTAVFAVLGATERALDVMAEAIRKRFYPAGFFRTHCRFVEPLRSEARFGVLVREAERREAVARQAVAGV